MIGLCHLNSGDDSHMAGGEFDMTGDCCWPEGSIRRGAHMHSRFYSYVSGLVALLHNIPSSFSSIAISTHTQSDIFNYHSEFQIRSTFRICSPTGNISITLPSYQNINDSDSANL